MNFRRGRALQLRALARYRLPKGLTHAEHAERFTAWMAMQGYDPVTQHTYRRRVDQFCRFLRNKSFNAVTPRDILAFIAKFDTRQHPDSYLYNILYTLRCFFDFLCLSGVVDIVAPRLIRFRKPPPQLPRVLTISEVRRLLNYTHDSRDRALLEILYATGCRAIEIARMCVEDIDFGRKEIRVEGKRAQRIVFFDRLAKVALLRYLKTRREGLVFLDRYLPQRGFLQHVGMRWYACWIHHPKRGAWSLEERFLGTSNGRSGITKAKAQTKLRRFIKTVNLGRRRHGLTTVTVNQIARRAGERAGIPNLTAKVLRCSFATHMLERGADVHVVQRMLGHQNISATEAYLSVSNTYIAKAYGKYHPSGN